MIGILFVTAVAAFGPGAKTQSLQQHQEVAVTEENWEALRGKLEEAEKKMAEDFNTWNTSDYLSSLTQGKEEPTAGSDAAGDQLRVEEVEDLKAKEDTMAADLNDLKNLKFKKISSFIERSGKDDPTDPASLDDDALADDIKDKSSTVSEEMDRAAGIAAGKANPVDSDGDSEGKSFVQEEKIDPVKKVDALIAQQDARNAKADDKMEKLQEKLQADLTHLATTEETVGVETNRTLYGIDHPHPSAGKKAHFDVAADGSVTNMDN